ncbi:MAG: mycofactocin biosynthesis glycosyltransferase MftF [Frankiaceae bacterium]
MTPAEVTVVIPARDRPAALSRCLRSVGPAAAVLVVDDASERPEAVAEVVATAGAQLYRRERNGGPAAARNSGLARSCTPFVAFVDSDCIPEPGWLARLLPHFEDPTVAAVAPRVIGLDAPGWLGRYEQARSALDLGARGGPVRPRSRISYVPAAALVARRSALAGLRGDAGFCPDFRVGEDVDLIWRLHRAGWQVRYEPAARVRHEHRVTLRAWAGRKFAYGTSAGPLARRHPGQVPPAVISVVALVPLALLRGGRPTAALAAGTLSAAGLSRRLPTFPGRSLEATRLMAAGCLTTGYGLATAATRVWLPLTVAGTSRYPAARRTLLLGALVGPALSWWTLRPWLDPLRWVLAYLIDDACYCAGVWVGAVRFRTAGPLLPAVPELARWGFRRRVVRRATAQSHSGRSGSGDSPSATEAEEINTGGSGNTDLHGQAAEVVEAAEEGPTGPTLGGG